MNPILLIEDDLTIAEAIRDKFKHWHLDVYLVEEFQQVLEEFKKITPQLVILDIQLPVYDGFHWCTEIRKISKVPILFLSSRDQPLDLIMALKMGGDDFVQKPFHMDVLLGKTQALLRRTYDYSEASSSAITQWNGAIIDFSKSTVVNKNKEIELTKNEQAIFKILLDHTDQIVSRDDIMRYLWDDERFINDNTLTVNVTRLRNRLEEIGLTNCIQTKRGLGYMLTSKEEVQ